MATCKDCIHERVCFALIKSGLPYDDLLPAEAFCMTFKNKADVVEVVRCKDCINYDNQFSVDNCGWCDEFNCGTSDERFCSYGERKEVKNNA